MCRTRLLYFAIFINILISYSAKTNSDKLEAISTHEREKAKWEELVFYFQ